MSAAKKKAASYEVGYGRPPVHTRFRKGRSGNPSGRRSRVNTMPEAIRRALDDHVTVTENGERKTMKRRDVIVRQLVIKASAGDLKAAALLLKYQEAPDEPTEPTQIVIGQDDLNL